MSTPFAAELIRRKRDGGRLHRDELTWIADAIASGELSDAQAAAFAMAVFFRGLDADERVSLTLGMAHSGAVLDWEDGAPVLDKHSTGGVGDKVSLVLAPLVAACGGRVPMLSGRGLGHTGGTLDKLDAIPGYTTQPTVERLRAAVAAAGCAIVGQTAELAPADRRLYAIRDASGSVESIGLIVASILSKKLAAGLGGLVLDVKHGSGAFMTRRSQALALAESLEDTALACGLPARAILTDMDEVLGRTAGNALEVREAIDHLTGAERDVRLHDVTMTLTRALLGLGRLDADADVVLAGGEPVERFARMVHALGGPADLVERPAEYLPQAPVVLEAHHDREGFVGAIDVRAVGLVVMGLGGGRRRESDAIDHAVGLSQVAGCGERVGPQERPLACVHARSREDAEAAAAALRRAFQLTEQPPEPRPVVGSRGDAADG